MLTERAIQFRSGGIELAGRLSAVAGASVGCVLCHPHPLYGGDMQSAIVVAIARALAAAGVATLRFDFRGAGESGGTHDGGAGEIDDVRAAVDTLLERAGSVRVVLAGYSFGAGVALAAAAIDPRVTAVAAVAPPIAMTECFAPAPALPVLAVCGNRDAYCPAADLASIASANPRIQAAVVTGADHFFSGFESEVARAVADFFAGR